MEHLPPVGWADVATKRDLDHLEERLSAKLDREVGDFRNALMAQQFRHTLAIVGILGTLTAVINALG